MIKLLENVAAHVGLKTAVLGAIAFAALFSLPLTAACVETSAEDIKSLERQEDLDFFYSTLKAEHPNPFSIAPESEFEAKVEALSETAGQMDDLTFILNLQSIMALVGDSHTNVSLGFGSAHLYDFAIEYFEDVPALAVAHKEYESLLGREVIAINEMPIAEVYERFSLFASHDNDIRLRRQFKQMSYIAEILAYLDVCEPGAEITVTVMDIEPVKIPLVPRSVEEVSNDENIVSLDDRREKTPATEFSRGKYYFSMPLDASTYYIQYNVCAEDRELPMEEFCARVREDLEPGNYSMVAVDLRYNSGGSDGVIFPLLNLLAEFQRNSGTKIFCLTGEITFSSAVINAIMMKEMGAIIIGAPTGGSVDHFGSTSRFSLPNSGIRIVMSSKMIEMREYFESGNQYGIETLNPDYAALETLEDYLRGDDTAVEYMLAHGETLELPNNDEAGLTRGRFIYLLHEKALSLGKGGETGATGFGDVFPFTYSTPAIEWAYSAGLLKDMPAELFGPSRLITTQEIFLLFEKFADYLGTPRHGTLLPGDFALRQTMTINEGRELINACFQP